MGNLINSIRAHPQLQKTGWKWLLFSLFLLSNSCEKPLQVDGDDLWFSDGVFILNEGNFMSDNASLSFYDPSEKRVHNQVFYQVNESPLGDVAHSMTLAGNMGYIVVNNSGRIYTVDLQNLQFRGKITGLTSPRYIRLLSPEKAYVSDLYARKIFIINPATSVILDTIDIAISDVRHNAEQMILHGEKLFVACWSYDNKILVIDTRTDELIDSIEVGKQPNSMVVDKNGFLWVLSDGGFTGSSYGQEKASLTRINLETHHADRMKIWEDIRVSPTDLCINYAGDTLYYLDGSVYLLPAAEFEEGGKIHIKDRGRQFYSLAIDPEDQAMYVADAVDYQQHGWVFRYSPAAELLDSFRVGINPGYFCFPE